ncbi:MAG: response regulator transcription factor [Anaerococcus sp.]|nr:response regulator transcription factor [Anaerococcus sp.]
MDKRILIVEDDKDISDIIAKTLLMNNFTYNRAYSGTEALLYMKENFDVIILDLMLPGLSGEEVLSEIKKIKDIPVLVLSSKDSIDSKLALLNGGADDYMTKPFNLDELIARVNILAKRNRQPINEGRLTYRELILDTRTYKAYIGKENLKLTKAEFRILKLFLENPNQVFTKEQIYEHTWEDYFIENDNSISVHVSNIRKKIKAHSQKEYIETVWGIGFKLSN